jgi:hypothetical protein
MEEPRAQPTDQPQSLASDLPEVAATPPKLAGLSAHKRIIEELQKQPHPVAGFLPDARVALAMEADAMNGDLGVEAVRIARERHATAVDVADLSEAKGRLRPNPRDPLVQGWLIGLGGVLCGGAIGTGITLALSQDLPTHSGYWLAGVALVAICGVLLFLWAYPKK